MIGLLTVRGFLATCRTRTIVPLHCRHTSLDLARVLEWSAYILPEASMRGSGWHEMRTFLGCDGNKNLRTCCARAWVRVVIGSYSQEEHAVHHGFHVFDWVQHGVHLRREHPNSSRQNKKNSKAIRHFPGFNPPLLLRCFLCEQQAPWRHSGHVNQSSDSPHGNGRSFVLSIRRCRSGCRTRHATASPSTISPAPQKKKCRQTPLRLCSPHALNSTERELHRGLDHYSAATGCALQTPRPELTPAHHRPHPFPFSSRAADLTGAFASRETGGAPRHPDPLQDFSENGGAAPRRSSTCDATYGRALTTTWPGMGSSLGPALSCVGA